MNIYIISGENSGDFLGSKLIDSLRKINPNISLRGVGGSLMKKSGFSSLFDISEINLMGFFEVIPHLFRIRRLIKKTVDDIIAQKADILVTIDSPAFTYRVAKALRKRQPDIKLVHIVAPSVWAYRPGRAQKYADLYDHLLTLFPFENEYFTKLGLAVTCIGHPIFQQKFIVNKNQAKKNFVNDMDIKLITVTPGSRPGEIKRHMPIIVEVFNQLSLKYNLKVLFVQSNDSLKYLINSYLQDARFAYAHTTERLKAFAAGDCALAKSGTNSFEIAASNTPMAIGYKVNFFTYYLLKMMIKIKYVCLINIIPNKNIIPEFLQNDFNTQNLCGVINKMLSNDQYCKKQINEAHEVMSSIGFGSDTEKPSDIAARTIIGLMN